MASSPGILFSCSCMPITIARAVVVTDSWKYTERGEYGQMHRPVRRAARLRATKKPRGSTLLDASFQLEAICPRGRDRVVADVHNYTTLRTGLPGIEMP